MKILVVGAGATGGFYGGKLALAGRDVTFLVRGSRAEQLRSTGLMLRTPDGDTTLAAPSLIATGELAGAETFDLILLSVKAYQFEQAMEDFAPAVREGTMILPIMNGFRHLESLESRFGAEPVLGGFCRIVGDMDEEGRVIQMTNLGDLFYGERDGTISERIQRVDAAMKGAGFEANLSPAILRQMWGKWIMMSSINTINPLGRGSVGEVEAVRELDGAGRRFETRALEEAFAVATAHGYAPDAATEAMLRLRLTEAGSTFESSLYRDLKRGFAVEADQIVGDMVRRGREKGIDMPLTEAAYVQLKVYEARRKA